jgi:hypothetical protein
MYIFFPKSSQANFFTVRQLPGAQTAAAQQTAS